MTFEEQIQQLELQIQQVREEINILMNRLDKTKSDAEIRVDMIKEEAKVFADTVEITSPSYTKNSYCDTEKATTELLEAILRKKLKI